MYRNICSTVLVLGVAATTSFASHAQLSKEQIEANRARWQSHVVAIDGSKTPSAIPYGEKMLMAFKVLDGRQSRVGPEAFRADSQARYTGSQADFDKLSQAVAQNKAFVDSVTQQETREMTGLCDELARESSTLTPAQIAERFRAVETHRSEALESHYSAVMQSLTPQMRAGIQSEIDTRFVPTMAWGTMDHIGLANAFPGVYPRVMKTNCARWSANRKD